MSKEKSEHLTKQLSVMALGKAIRIGSKSKVVIFDKGYSVSFPDEPVAQVNITIGKEHEAVLVMPLTTLENLYVNGKDISIETFQNFIKQTRSCLKQQLQALSTQS